MLTEEPMKTRVLLTAAALALAAAAGNAQQTASDGLGTVHFLISCTGVQAEFERAVALLHNFHYPETVKAFQAVIKDDPDWRDRILGAGDERDAEPAGAAVPAGCHQDGAGGDPAGQDGENA
jgi:hypothetical protein